MGIKDFNCLVTHQSPAQRNCKNHPWGFLLRKQMQTSKVHSQVLLFKDSFPEVAQMSSAALAGLYLGKSSWLHLWGSSVTMLYIKLGLLRSVRSRFFIPNSWKDLFIVIMAQSVQLKQGWSHPMGHPQNVLCNSASRSYLIPLPVSCLSLEQNHPKQEEGTQTPLLASAEMLEHLQRGRTGLSSIPDLRRFKPPYHLSAEQPDNFQVSYGHQRCRIAELMKSNKSKKEPSYGPW